MKKLSMAKMSEQSKDRLGEQEEKKLSWGLAGSK